MLVTALSCLIAVQLIVILCMALFLSAKERVIKAYAEKLAEDPFTLDMAKLTQKITIEREGGRKTVELSLLQILDVTSTEEKSMREIADDLSKEAGLNVEDKFSEAEARIILLYSSPSLADFATSLKKALPFG